MKKHSGNIETFAFFTSLPSSPNYEINADDRIQNQKQHVYAKGTFIGVLAANLYKERHVCHSHEKTKNIGDHRPIKKSGAIVVQIK